ncbi:MAG: hypothetical protein AABX23_00685 [Nanoarchaeota archaeon]
MEWVVSTKRKHVYEALGCISDKRIEIDLNNGAKVYSSSRNKFYNVNFDSKTNSIMCNDNTSYYTDTLSYPCIALLLTNGIISYNPFFAQWLKGIKWKDVNQKFKNDYTKTEAYVGELIKERDLSFDELNKEVDSINEQLFKLKVKMLGKKLKPPVGY